MNFVKERHEDMSEERVIVKLLVFDVQSVQKEIVGHIVHRIVYSLFMYLKVLLLLSCEIAA